MYMVQKLFAVFPVRSKKRDMLTTLKLHYVRSTNNIWGETRVNGTYKDQRAVNCFDERHQGIFYPLSGQVPSGLSHICIGVAWLLKKEQWRNCGKIPG